MLYSHWAFLETMRSIALVFSLIMRSIHIGKKKLLKELSLCPKINSARSKSLKYLCFHHQIAKIVG